MESGVKACMAGERQFSDGKPLRVDGNVPFITITQQSNGIHLEFNLVIAVSRYMLCNERVYNVWQDYSQVDMIMPLVYQRDLVCM